MFKYLISNMSTNEYIKYVSDGLPVNFGYTKESSSAKVFHSIGEVAGVLKTFPDGLFEIITVYDLR